MKELIACCGLNCEECDARIAYVTNDDNLREITAEKWRKQYNSDEITADMINCTGCRIEGVKIVHCAECKIRICVEEKGFATCADCTDIDSCETVGWLHNVVPQAKMNLLTIK
ncbi:MAG: hypothetical protein C0596_08640 [Marinilabiliales bacterium]|nr:MAG: hypothetical protein C0596_08640 [Marinilabiliales bacterium]